MAPAPVEGIDDESLALNRLDETAFTSHQRNEATSGEQGHSHCNKVISEAAISDGVDREASQVELPGSVAPPTSGISLGYDDGDDSYVNKTETGCSDTTHVECDQDSPSIRKHLTYSNRLESQLYAEVAKPDPRALDAAVRVLESKSFRSRPSTKDFRKDSIETEASHAPSGLSGFYRKLLGGDWEDQLQQIDKEEVDNIYASTHISRNNSAEDLLILSGGGANYQERFRQRIRRRDATQIKDISDEVADDLQVSGDDEPLITAAEIAEARKNAWKPSGVCVPPLTTIALQYHEAWDIGKRGCLATKINRAWTSALVPNKTRFFVMDGTDPDAFLTYYNRSDLEVLRGFSPEKLGSISAWDLRNGQWFYNKTRVFFKRSDKHNKDCVLGNFPLSFYEAMLVCLWHMEGQFQIEHIKNKRRGERSRRKQSCLQASAAASTTKRQSVSLARYTTSANRHLADCLPRPGTPQTNLRKPKQSVVTDFTEAVKVMGSKDCVAAWVETRSLERQSYQDHRRKNDISFARNGVSALPYSTAVAYQQSRQQPSMAIIRPPATPCATEGIETPSLSSDSSPRETEEYPPMFG